MRLPSSQAEFMILRIVVSSSGCVSWLQRPTAASATTVLKVTLSTPSALSMASLISTSGHAELHALDHVGAVGQFLRHLRSRRKAMTVLRHAPSTLMRACAMACPTVSKPDLPAVQLIDGRRLGGG